MTELIYRVDPDGDSGHEAPADATLEALARLVGYSGRITSNPSTGSDRQ